MTFRISVKTSAGNFLCTPTQTVAKVDKDGKKYVFVHELREGNTVLVSRTCAEELTLEGHIIPTLWSRSEKYRRDRELVFAGEAAEVPTRTRLSEYLMSIAAGHGAHVGAEAVKVIQGVISALPEELHYSYSGVAAWLDSGVMFPERPEVLMHVAHALNSPALEKWAMSIVEQGQLPVRRLRAVHRGIRASLAQSKGSRSVNKGAGGPEEADKEKGHGIVKTGELIRMLREEYGDSAFGEFVSAVKVLETPMPTGVSAEKNSEEVQDADSGLSRKMIGFSYTKPEERREVLERYGQGAEIGAEIGASLARRKELAFALMNRFGILASGIESDWIRRNGYPGEKVTFNRLNRIFTQTMIFGNVTGFYREEFETEVEIWTNKRVRNAVRNLLKITDPKVFYKEAERLKSLSRYINKFSSVYGRSLIERFVLSKEEFLSIFSFDMEGIKKKTLNKLRNYEELVRKIDLAEMKNSNIQVIKHAEQYESIFGDAEFRRIFDEQRNLQIPYVFVYAQHGVGNTVALEKLMVAYGVGDIHNISFDFEVRISGTR